MAFLDGAGNTQFPAFRSLSVTAVNKYESVPVSPVNGDRIPSTAANLIVDVSNTDGTNSDVQFDVATDAGFASVIFSTTRTNIPNGQLTTVAAGLTSGTTYWWRTRLAPTGTTTWGPYGAGRFVPDLNSGRTVMSVDWNVGFVSVYDPDVTAVAEVDWNVGFDLPLDKDVTAAAYTDWNVGVSITQDSDALEYVHFGDVNTLTPTPHVWFLKPKSGRPGDGVRIFCFGAGDLQATYGGTVEAFFPASGWTAVPVLHWQTFPETANAYGPLRTLDELSEIIDEQHTVIEITVPSGALPPGIPIRIKTNGA